jgi:hypothetical protein
MSVILERSLAALKATGAKYIVVMPDGAQYSEGGLKLEASSNKPRRKRGLEHPIGAIKGHYLPYIRDLKPGEMAEVPFDKFRPELVASGVSSYATATWGKQSAITARNIHKNVVEILRMR